MCRSEMHQGEHEQKTSHLSPNRGHRVRVVAGGFWTHKVYNILALHQATLLHQLEFLYGFQVLLCFFFTGFLKETSLCISQTVCRIHNYINLLQCNIIFLQCQLAPLRQL